MWSAKGKEFGEFFSRLTSTLLPAPCPCSPLPLAGHLPLTVMPGEFCSPAACSIGLRWLELAGSACLGSSSLAGEHMDQDAAFDGQSWPAVPCDLNQEPASRTPECRESWVKEEASLAPHRWPILFALFPLSPQHCVGLPRRQGTDRPRRGGVGGSRRSRRATPSSPAPPLLPRRSWNSRGCFWNSNQSLPTPTLWSSVPLWGGGSAGLDPAAGSAGFSGPWACICVVRKHLRFLKGRKKLAAELFCSRVDERLWDDAVDHHGGPGQLHGDVPGSQAPRPRFLLWTSLSSTGLSDSRWTATPSFEKEQCLLTASSDDEPAPFVHANAYMRPCLDLTGL